MAALTAAKMVKSRGITRKVKYLMKASTTCYQGGLICIDSAGLAVPAADVSGHKQCVGVAVASVTSESSGSYYVEVLEGEFLLTASAVAQTGVGAMAYAEDDQTVDDASNANEPVAGKIIEFVSSTSCWVRVGPNTAIA
jgi:hypothetical protein